MTRRPCRDAMSRSARGGVVWGMRTALIPFAAISAKSRSTVARSWYSFPAASGVNTPHVQLLVADKEELAAHTGPDSRRRCWGGLKCRRGWLHVAAQTRRRSHDQPAVVTLVGRPFGGALYDAPHGTPRACEGASDDPSWSQTRKRHAVCRRAKANCANCTAQGRKAV